MVLLAALHWAAPARRGRPFRLITPGTSVVTAIWIAGSAAYALYVTNFGAYNDVYGSLGALFGFLAWIWLANMAMLYGEELNAEVERRATARGLARS
jgi:membrane protein